MKLFGKPLELVILDVDGVILNLMACFQKNLEAAAIRAGLQIEPIRQYLSCEDIKPSLHEGVRQIWPGIRERAAEKFSDIFREEERRNPYPPREGSIETIYWFRKHHVPVALCTTNDLETLAHRFRSACIDFSWFAAMSFGGNGYPTKPDPRTLDPIFNLVPVSREEAVYVGDWYPDLETARGGGVRFVAALSGVISRRAFLDKGVPEDHILEKLSDLPKLIE